MSLLRSLVRLLLPPGARAALRRWLENEVSRPPASAMPESFAGHRNSAWKRGYGAGYEKFKARFCASAIGDGDLLEQLRTTGDLPPGYGIGMDERCIEFPWIVANVGPGPGLLLDAGSTLNHAYVLDHPAIADKRLTVVTLAPEREAYWPRGISYVYGDLRDLDFKDGRFDLITCVSTLEHVGLDNTDFTRLEMHREQRPEDFRVVMRELARVLRPGGVLYLTVPYGVRRVFRNQHVFDRGLLEEALDAFSPSTRLVRLYRYDANGWAPSSDAACADREYVEWTTHLPDDWPDPIPIESDFAIAARAVACVRLGKRG